VRKSIGFRKSGAYSEHGQLPFPTDSLGRARGLLLSELHRAAPGRTLLPAAQIVPAPGNSSAPACSIAFPCLRLETCAVREIRKMQGFRPAGWSCRLQMSKASFAALGEAAVETRLIGACSFERGHLAAPAAIKKTFVGIACSPHLVSLLDCQALPAHSPGISEF